MQHDNGLVCLKVVNLSCPLRLSSNAVQNEGAQLLHLTTRQARLEDVSWA